MQKVSLRRLAASMLAGSILLAGCSTAAPQPQELTSATSMPAVEGTAAPVMAPTVPAAGLRDGNVVVNGRVSPASSYELVLPNGGSVTDVLVSEGDTVTAGQPLVRLDVRSLELRVKEAEANLAEARAAYELLLASATPEQQAEARAQIEQARAGLRAAQARALPEDIAAARADLKSAEEALAEATDETDPELLAVAQAEVDQANAALQSVRDSMAAEKQQAELRIERLANNLRDAQDFYQRVYWQNRNRFGDEIPDDEAAEEAKALRAVQNAEFLLIEGRSEYEQLVKNEASRIAAAQAIVDEAENRKVQLVQGPERSEISDLQAQVEVARARLRDLTGETEASIIARAQAEVAEAEAAYAQLVAAPTAPELAIAEARVQRNEAQLAQARLDLEEGELRSPIEGVVARVAIEPGQPYTANEVVMVVADLSNWQIETDSLNELSVVHIREGDKATISFYALPGFTIPGTVSYITTIGQTDEDNELTSVYQLVITPDTWDPRLRWNMTASVTIAPGTVGGAAQPAGGRP